MSLGHTDLLVDLCVCVCVEAAALETKQFGGLAMRTPQNSSPHFCPTAPLLVCSPGHNVHCLVYLFLLVVLTTCSSNVTCIAQTLSPNPQGVHLGE